MAHEYDDDEPREKCGVFGIYAPELDVSRVAFFALVALQHRGQESCGIATYDELGSVHLETGMGLVNQVFNETNLKPLKGKLAVGHTRYSTTGRSTLENAQPMFIQTLRGHIAVCQNGNLTTAKTLRQGLLEKGIGMFRTSDVEIITQMLASNPSTAPQNGVASDTWEARIASFMQKADGAYSLVIMTSDAVFGCRDYLGMRPLCIGSITVDVPGGGTKTRYVVASETCAISTIGGKYVPEVRPGEIVRLDANGLHSYIGREESPSPALCVFEYVYFSRPDSLLQNQLIHRVRQRLGEQLAIESPPPPPKDASGKLGELCVIGVPDSSLPAAIGYANKCGINYSEGLTKNRYIHRTFIQPTDYLRKLGVSLKFNPLTDNISGKRIVLIDDSIVRGNTITALVSMLRGAGATEVHVRISSPPVRHPCFMGIDMATYEQLTSHNHTVEETCKLIGADSLAYISHEGMMLAVRSGARPEPQAKVEVKIDDTKAATNDNKVDKKEGDKDATCTSTKGDQQQGDKKNYGYCSACFTGDYPLKLDW
jgi:amidophosphoribosyltransferase